MQDNFGTNLFYINFFLFFHQFLALCVFSAYIIHGFPCIVKPCSCGSSVGVSIVNNENELNNALEFAAKYENSILIEKHIAGRTEEGGT